ncbi:MAG TPA: hypothetical protein VHT91_06455 [Kofleriaceae bacterium]|jgi:hypothetical protein|nr:hypothetical protein [Kofleriaceae bacterium]
MRLLALAATVLIGCGNVAATAHDAGPSDGAAGDAAFNPCAPDTCLLADDFTGATLNGSLWGTATGGGATITQANGLLTIQLPAVINAFADVYSLVGFPTGTLFEAKVTINAGQFYDHKAIGFSSSRIDEQCNAGETDAVMFRSQDGDAYVETKAANAYTCDVTTTMYLGGTSTYQIARTATQVVFTRDGASRPAVTATLPTGLLPVRFSAFTYSMNKPMQPVQIDVDYVFVKRQ